MRSLYFLSLIFSLVIAMPESGASTPKQGKQELTFSCDGMKGFFEGFKDQETCEQTSVARAEQEWESSNSFLYKIYKSDIDELCAFSEGAPRINQGRCQRAAQNIKDVFDKRREGAKRICAPIAHHKQACSACNGTNATQTACAAANEQIAAREVQYHEWIEGIHRENLRLARRIRRAGVAAAGDFAQNRDQVERDAMNNNTNSPAARDIGATSPREALSLHGAESAGNLHRIIQEMNNASNISKSDIERVNNLQNPYVRESLSLAAAAAAAEQDIQKELERSQAARQQKTAYSEKIKTNNKNMTSLTTPEASRSQIAGEPSSGGSPDMSSLAGMAGGMGGAGGGAGGAGGMGSPAFPNDSSARIGQQGSPGSTTYSAVASNGAAGGALNQGANAIAANAGGTVTMTGLEQALEQQAVAAGGPADASAASRSAALRDSIRARLAAKMGEDGAAAATGVDAAGAQAASGGGTGPGEKAKGLGASILDGFAEFDSGGSRGGPRAGFSMSGSETDAFVQNMLSEFEGEFGDHRRNRGLASMAQENAPEIGGEDSPSLFSRTKDSHKRCIRRGCVTAGDAI